MFPINSRLRAALLLSIAMAATLAAAPAAHAWYVDLSITGAGNVWEFTDANELDEHCTAFPEEGFSSPSTTPTDTLGATCRAGDASGDYGHGWIVEYRAVPAPGYRFERWRARTGESETSIKCDGSGGSAEYTGTNCRFQIFENLHTQARFVDDTAPSMSTLNGPTGQINGSAEFTFSAAPDPTFARFECRLVTAGESQIHDWQTCSSGHDEDPAAAGTEGGYKLYVRAVDRSNNTSAASSWSWSVDKIRPETTLDSLSGPSGTTSSTSATFNFTGSADVASYRCRLDDAETSCESPVTYSDLDDGEHTFEVWSRDDAGNDDSSPATRTWTVDTAAPDTTLAGGPAEGSSTTSTSASFTFTSSEAGTFECQIDGTGFEDCESPRNVTGLTPGEHTFAVRARDEADNADPTPATRQWTVTAPPDPDPDPGTGGTGGTGGGGTSTPPGGGGTSTPPGGGGTTGPATDDVIPAKVRTFWKLFGKRTRVAALTVSGAPVGSKITVTCKSKRKGCKFRKLRLTMRGSKLALAKRFKRKKLRAGAVITIVVAKEGMVAKTFRYKTRARKFPKAHIT